MKTSSKKNDSVQLKHSFGDFLSRNGFMFTGAVDFTSPVSSILFPNDINLKSHRQDYDNLQVFDCPLHCHAES